MGCRMGLHVLACALLAIAVNGRSMAAQANAPKVPDSVQALEGRRVLLIIIPERTPQKAYFVPGAAHWTGAALEVRAGPREPAAVAVGSPRALRPFSPTMLLRLIVPEHATKVATLARGATACVVIFAPAAPPVGVVLETPFFGLARGQGGEALLMQGEAPER